MCRLGRQAAQGQATLAEPEGVQGFAKNPTPHLQCF